MLHIKAGVVVEPGPERQQARLDHAFVGAQARRRHVGVVAGPLVRPGLEAGRRVEIVGDLEVVDVDVDRVLVIVVVDVGPLLDRAEPRLDQPGVGECLAVEGVDERLGVRLARQIVEESAADHHLPADIGLPVGDVDERAVGAERLALGEHRRLPLAVAGHRAGQDLGREDEEPVGIADRRGQHAEAAEHPRRIVGAVVGVADSRRADRLGAAAARRHLQHQVPARRHRHRDRDACRRRNQQPRAALGRRIVHRRRRVAVLADDGELRMTAGRRLGQLHVHVGDVADVREHPDLGLSRLAADDRLEQAVDGELHVALPVGQRRVGRHVLARLAGERGEALQVARDELEQPAIVQDREMARPPDGDVVRARLRLAEVDRRQQRAIGAFGELVAGRRGERADELRPVGVVELGEAAAAVEHGVVLQHHGADRDVVRRHQRQVAVGASDRQQAGQAEIGLSRGQRMEMAVIPVGALRHVRRDPVGVGVRHPRRDVEHDVVGIALGADMHAMHVQVHRRGGQLRRIERHRAVLPGVWRIEDVADGKIGERVVEMDDQRFAGKHLQGRRRVEIVARHFAVGRGAALHAIGEDQEILDWPRDGVEQGVALMRRQRHLENAVLARQGHRLPEGGPDRRIERALRPARRDASQQPDRDRAQRDRAQQPIHPVPPRRMRGRAAGPRLPASLAQFSASTYRARLALPRRGSPAILRISLFPLPRKGLYG